MTKSPTRQESLDIASSGKRIGVAIRGRRSGDMAEVTLMWQTAPWRITPTGEGPMRWSMFSPQSSGGWTGSEPMIQFSIASAEARQAWVSRARCRVTDPDELFVRGAAQKKAAAICRHCPVIDECAVDALENRVEFGVWGGMTERGHLVGRVLQRPTQRTLLLVSGPMAAHRDRAPLSHHPMPTRREGKWTLTGCGKSVSGLAWAVVLAVLLTMRSGMAVAPPDQPGANGAVRMS
jgi:hypothetical protein